MQAQVYYLRKGGGQKEVQAEMNMQDTTAALLLFQCCILAHSTLFPSISCLLTPYPTADFRLVKPHTIYLLVLFPANSSVVDLQRIKTLLSFSGSNGPIEMVHLSKCPD